MLPFHVVIIIATTPALAYFVLMTRRSKQARVAAPAARPAAARTARGHSMRRDTNLKPFVALSVIPPLVLALVFQRFITRLNIVDPITTRDI